MAHLLEEVARADEVGLDSFGIGEHHRSEYFDSAPAVLLAAAAARTSRIRLNSAVTVLSADDPVRVFQDFATLDLISRGRMDLVVGRGSFTEAFPLFGLSLRDYDDLFAEKLDLLLRIGASPAVHWSGHRAGHPADQLRVGLHCFGFVGDTSQQAVDDFYPGWAEMFSRIGKERGGPPPTRARLAHGRRHTGSEPCANPATCVQAGLTLSGRRRRPPRGGRGRSRPARRGGRGGPARPARARPARRRAGPGLRGRPVRRSSPGTCR